jgi:dTDP-glucose 4,6-dehydratase
MAVSWNGVPVLVTGAGGFIGSHLTEALLARGARVRAFVRYNSRGDVGLLRYARTDIAGDRGALDVVAGDLRDPHAVLEAAEGCELVFHLGAMISIPYSYRHPAEVVGANVEGTLNVLEAARRTRPRRLVHTSTSEVYGSAQVVPIAEDHPLQGQSPYSASKIGADRIAESYFRSFDVQVITLRPFNTYGPRQSTRAVIPTIVTQALAGGPVRLGSLFPTRDFTYVDDTVRGFILAAEADGVAGCEVNLGTNQETSIGDLVSTIGRILQREIVVASEPERVRPERSEVLRLRADNSLAKRLLGWEPQISLEAGLRRTIDWIREHAELFQPGVYQV